jgi:hypothetical protein
MSCNKQRSPTLAGIYDFNTLHLREHNANINTKNYLSSNPPMSYRDLHLVVTNRIPSNLLIIPKSLTSFQTPILRQQKKEHKKIRKQASFDVYRSLTRSIAHSSTTSDRDLSHDEMIVVSNSLGVDRTSPLSNTGYYRPNILPKIQKHHNNSNENQKLNNKIKTNYEHIDFKRSTSPKIFDRTTPNNQYYEENNDKIPTTTKVFSYVPTNRSRKQLHVYVPTINC